MAEDEISFNKLSTNDIAEKIFSFEEIEVNDNDFEASSQNEIKENENKSFASQLETSEEDDGQEEENISKSSIDENKKEVNVDDDSDSFSFSDNQPVTLLEELAYSNYLYNRQLAARKLLETLQQVGSNEKELQSVISIMCKLSEDEEFMVQFELMQHIPAIASYCQSEPHLRIIIRQQLMPFTVKLLNDIQILLRRAGQTALIGLLEKNLIDDSQLVEWICPLIAQLVLCENNIEELRIEDVSLMCKMIPLVGRDTTMKFFLKPFITLCNGFSCGIRKTCAHGIGSLCKVVGTETTELSLLPVFLNLCNCDKFNVRKACAEVFVDVATSVSLKTKKEILPHIFVNLLTDHANYVKCVAYQNLGAFIYTFADPKKTGFCCVNGKISAVPRTSMKTWRKNSLNNNESPPNKLIDEQKFSLTNFKSDSLAITSRNGHVYLHVDNENLFNNFQFWRMPLPEIELDIDIEDGKTTNISVRAKVPSDDGVVPVSEVKVSIASEPSSNVTSNENANVPRFKKMLVQTACINTLASQDQCLLDDDTEVLRSSFKEAVLTFNSDEPDESIGTSSFSLTSEIEKTQKIQEVKTNELAMMTPEDQDIVPPILLFPFISAVDNSSYELERLVYSAEDEILGHIAYSFPAVALTLGEKYWPCIKQTCEKLARNMKWTVRKTIASSLHELASFLSYEIIMADLLPIFLDLFKDLDEVRLPLVQHLSEFIRHLSPHDRKQFLPFIEEFTQLDNERNWRYRFAVTEQLRKTVCLFDAVETKDYFFPVACMFLPDKVSAVRHSAVHLTAVLLRKMRQDSRTESCYPCMLEGFDVAYRQGQKWVLRQTYILLCEQIVLNDSVCMSEFVEEIASKLFSLAYDKVPNVRLLLAKSIVSTFLPLNIVSFISSTQSQELFFKAVEHLSSDVDKDVRYFGEKALRAIK